MLDIPAEIAEIEGRLYAAGVTVKAMLRQAQIAESQWQRWKTSKRIPRRDDWDRIETAVMEVMK
ncbi:MAG TPA: hypothetical protein VIY86_06910 [Pirellulaceae bacterium]